MSESTPLIAAPRKRGRLYAIIAAAVVVVVAIVVGVFAIGGSSGAVAEGRGSAGDPVRIGVVGASDPYWADYEAAATAAGISIELVDFTDYAQPNVALSEGDLDLNQFQHLIYLAQYNESAGDNLVPIGATAIYPLSLYSTKYNSVKEFQNGDTVAVPNDASNLSRSLLVLQAAGLVELTDGGSPFSTVADVLPSSTVKVTTLDANLTPTSLPDVAAAVINNDYVDDAGLTVDEALSSDDPADPTAQPYINIFAARNEDKDDEVLNRLVEIFHETKTVTDGLIDVSGGTAEIVETPPAELAQLLKQVQSDVAAG